MITEMMRDYASYTGEGAAVQIRFSGDGTNGRWDEDDEFDIPRLTITLYRGNPGTYEPIDGSEVAMKLPARGTRYGDARRIAEKIFRKVQRRIRDGGSMDSIVEQLKLIECPYMKFCETELCLRQIKNEQRFCQVHACP